MSDYHKYINVHALIYKKTMKALEFNLKTLSLLSKCKV